MDAQGRGRAGKIDPADQWVLNPQTGNYELRLTLPGKRSRALRPQGARPRRARRDPGRGGRRHRHAPAPDRRGRRGDGSRRGRTCAGAGGAARGQRAPAAAAGPAAGEAQAEEVGEEEGAAAGPAACWRSSSSPAPAAAYLSTSTSTATSTRSTSARQRRGSEGPAINILLIGTDKRTGTGNAGYGDTGSVGHADTTLLLHVSKDRTNATALSIPRDLITDIPDCPTKQKDGIEKVIPGRADARFNTSLGPGAAATPAAPCGPSTSSPASFDHFMMADFNAVKTLSDGGRRCRRLSRPRTSTTPSRI